MSKSPPQKQADSKFDPDVLKDAIVHANVELSYVIITTDKLKICLIEHGQALNEKRSWIAPLGLFVALATSLFATDFKDIFYLRADTWQAIYIVATVLSLIWFVCAIVSAYKSRDCTLDSLILKIQRKG